MQASQPPELCRDAAFLVNREVVSKETPSFEEPTCCFHSGFYIFFMNKQTAALDPLKVFLFIVDFFTFFIEAETFLSPAHNLKST